MSENTDISKATELLELKGKLLGSFLLFTQFFYKLRTGRDFVLAQPIGRESYHITIAKYFTKVFNGEIPRLITNTPPRYGKSELVIHFIAWGLAHYPDSQYIYVSYALSLAQKQTQTIREIIKLPIYKSLFGVKLSPDVHSKHNFETTAGGAVYAAGVNGPITGRGAGLFGVKRWGGCPVIDDYIKPEDAPSDAMRESSKEWFDRTLRSRLNDPSTPILLIAQRLHEDEMSTMLSKREGWVSLILPIRDEAGNVLDPKKHSKEAVALWEKEAPYDFAAQAMQNPQPAGGGLFKPEWFKIIDIKPNDIIFTFITCDTAETDKEYNDASVFSFWGVYYDQIREYKTKQLCLHWIGCEELRVQPKDLKDSFLDFWCMCMNYEVKPSLCAIEEKSTGTTLISVLKTIRGLNIHKVKRSVKNFSKVSRFIQIQPYIAKELISISPDAIHKDMVIEHCRKITANNSHAHDDIADTLEQAVNGIYINKDLNYLLLDEENNKSDMHKKIISGMDMYIRAQNDRMKPVFNDNFIR